MRFKLTFILLLANLAVFFVLWRLDRPAAPVPKASGPIAKDFTPDHITINDYRTKEVREFKRGTDGKWSIVQPFNWPANEFAVRDIYTNLQLLDVGANITPDQLHGQSYKDFGLDQPILDVTLADSAHKQTLEVGQPTARGGNFYTMNPDDKIVRVVAQSALASLFSPLEDLRDNNIFSTPMFEARSLSVWSPKLVKFVKDGEVWQLDTPLRRAADTAKVNNVVSQLNGMTVARFLTATEADQARAGLANPKLTIELEGESSQTLHVGDDVPEAPTPQVYAQLEGSKIIFTLAKNELLVTTLPQAQDALRQRQFLDFDPAKVTTLSISAPDGVVGLERLENRVWQVRDKDSSGAPHPFDADVDIMRTLLDSLHALTAKTFASDAPGDLTPFGLAPTQSKEIKVVLHADKVWSLVVGTPDDAPPFHYFAKVDGVDTVYEVEGAILNQLSAQPLHYRDRVLESLPAAAQITSLKLTHLTDNQAVFNYTLPENATWEDYLRGIPDSIKRDPLLNVRDYVRKFTVQNYRAGAFTENYPMATGAGTPPVEAPWRYRLDAGVKMPAAGSTPAQNQTVSFYFSDPLTPGLQMGGAKEPAPGAVFELTQYLIGDLGILTMELSRPAVVTQMLNQMGQPINPAPPPASTEPAPAITPPVITPPVIAPPEVTPPVIAPPAATAGVPLPAAT